MESIHEEAEKDYKQDKHSLINLQSIIKQFNIFELAVPERKTGAGTKILTKIIPKTFPLDKNYEP